MFDNVYAGKRVLITGHTGFKGSWLASWLLKLGAKVYGLSLDDQTEPSHFNLLNFGKEVKHSKGDVRDQAFLENYIEETNPEFIFHLAAKAIVRDCYENPIDAFMTNSFGSLNVLHSLKRAEALKAVVMITSDKCYENVEWEYGYKEDDQLGGKDPYSASKACAELLFSSFFRSYFGKAGFHISTARAGNVIGGGDWARDRIVPDCIRSWAEKKSVEIRSPLATRPWQHVLEPLSGYLWLGASLYQKEREGLNGEAFNFGPSSDVNKPVSDLISEMNKYWDDGKWHKNESAMGAKKEANLLKLCCDKALHRLDWLPNLSFQETVEFTVNWYKNYYLQKISSIREYTLGQISSYEDLAKKRKRAWAK